jgi:catechol 2,3-dioxygenase-like lactoylglutathione lyase family enzyme
MITGVGFVSVLVNDPDKSAKWYRDKLGFEIVENKGHAVYVRPRGSRTPLVHLCGKCDDWGTEKPGGRAGVWFSSGRVRIQKFKKSGATLPLGDPDDVEKTYRELKRKGVEFSQELMKMPWGKMAIFRDLDGNEFEIS